MVMASFYFLHVLTVSFLIGICSIQGFLGQQVNPCISKLKCGECITAGPCAWCSQEDFDGAYRCDFPSKLLGNCSKSTYYYPINSVEIPTGNALSERGTYGGMVQVPPQAPRIFIKPNSPQSTNVRFRQMAEYPMDIYLLMDMSQPKSEYTSHLGDLADLLANNLPRITSNIRLGFGTFVGLDISVAAERLESSRAAQLNHRMSLSMGTSGFAEGVDDLRIHVSGIPGFQTGLQVTLSAIMQVIICKKEIGWRKNSNKLLIFASNSGIEYPEDEKAKREIPNSHIDRCYLDQSDSSSESFPRKNYTIDEVNQKLKEDKINVIFAVTPAHHEVYVALSERLEGSDVGIFSYYPSSILDLVEQYYQGRSADVQLTSNASANTRVNFYSNCLDGQRKETNVCKGLRTGDEVYFEIVIEVTSCPKDPSLWKDKITIYREGARDSMKIDLELICSCPCEEPQYKEINSKKCSKGGTFQCGVCSCNKNHSGRRCECESRTAEDGSTTTFHAQTGKGC